MARGLAGEPSPVGGRTPLLVFLGWDPARVRLRSPELSRSSGSLTFLIQNISHFQGNKKRSSKNRFWAIAHFQVCRGRVGQAGRTCITSCLPDCRSRAVEFEAKHTRSGSRRVETEAKPPVTPRGRAGQAGRADEPGGSVGRSVKLS